MTSRLQPPSPAHLRLAIRTTLRFSFLVQGDREREIGRRFSSGNAAINAIAIYCRRYKCTALVQIFFPNTERWREDLITQTGRVQSIYLGGSRVSGTEVDLAADASENEATGR